MAIVRQIADAVAQPVLEGVTMRMMIGPDQGAPVFNMRIFDVQPGRATPYHQHWWEHEVFILAGKGAIRIESGETPIQAGAAILVHRNEMHQFINTGEEAFRFMCLVPQEWLETHEGLSQTSVCCG